MFRNIKLHFAVNKQIKNLKPKQKLDFDMQWKQDYKAKKTNLMYDKWLRQHIAATIRKK